MNHKAKNIILGALGVWGAIGMLTLILSMLFDNWGVGFFLWMCASISGAGIAASGAAMTAALAVWRGDK